MESLIQIISNLQQVSNAIGDDGSDLLRIVVVGSQGSGKSSVLENIVGRYFLPKGTGIVTRTPLVLNLVHSNRESGPHRREEDGTLDAEEYGVFSHTDKIFKDYDDICSEIQRQTETIAGHNKGIGYEEIRLNLYSPRLPNLTLVDLPGLTKFPIGDQPDDVETCIRDLVLKYIQNTDAIIMAVVPANTDMATNESLKLAKDCDPEGLRTLVVLTKVDLMDDGTDATDILTGKVIPVNLGIVAVVNRSQKDIADKRPIAQAIVDEARFLRLKYPSLADCNGTSFLVATLKKILLNCIKDYLVKVRSRVEMKILQVEALVDFYSDDDEEQDRGLMKIIREFSTVFSQDVRASGANLETKTRENEIPIYHIIHKIFKTELNKINHCCTQKDIVYWMYYRNDPHLLFKELLETTIEKMKKPSIDCAQDVFEEMNRILWKCAYEKNVLIQKFPALRNKIGLLFVLGSLLRTKHSIAEKAIRDESFYEFSSIIFNIRRFHRNSDVLNREKFQKATKDEKCDIIEKYLPLYFETARESVHTDVTVKIMQLLVNAVQNNVEDELVGNFSSRGTGRIFHGLQSFSEERKKEKKTLEALCKARDIIGELEEKC